MANRRFFRAIKRFAGQFLRQESGVVVVIFSVTLPVLITLVAVTYDYTTATRLRAVTLQALDAALLSTARQLSTGEIETSDIDQTVNAFFQGNIIGKNIEAERIGTVVATFDSSNDRLLGTVEGSSPALFTGIINPDGVSIGVSSSVAVDRQLIELALVLDVTGSMAGSKLVSLQRAARTLVDTLLPQGNSGRTEAQVRLSIVPYADLVNIGPYERRVTGYTSGESCVYERSGSLAFADAPPVGPIAGTGDDDDGVLNVNAAQTGDRTEKIIVNDVRNFRGYACSYPVMTPLTADAQTLNQQIDAFTANGTTAGHIGIQWGWFSLSNRYQGIWPSESRPVDYGRDDTKKAMVVMTDGAFNTWFENGLGDSFQQARTLCDDIKDIGIVIYTVGFQTQSAEESFLRACASSPGHYFDTSTESALVAAFEEIGNNLNAIRLAQ